MKMSLKIRKLWHFEVSQISRNISWPVDMNMQMSELMMSLPHKFPLISYTEITKISYISAIDENVRLALKFLSE